MPYVYSTSKGVRAFLPLLKDRWLNCVKNDESILPGLKKAIHAMPGGALLYVTRCINRASIFFILRGLYVT